MLMFTLWSNGAFSVIKLHSLLHRVNAYRLQLTANSPDALKIKGRGPDRDASGLTGNAKNNK